MAFLTKLSMLLTKGMPFCFNSLTANGNSVQPNTTAFAPQEIKLSITLTNKKCASVICPALIKSIAG